MLIGRQKEQKILKEALQSNRAELIVIYGRRRVGKTFLIRETYKKVIKFELVGMYKAPVREHFRNFKNALHYYSGEKRRAPTNWIEAFGQLKDYCDTLKGDKKKVIFMDEFPWLDNNKSSFLRAFDNFWNGYVTKRRDLLIVICGSAASYMIKRIIKSKGGLHNRLTEAIRLEPFNLAESAALLRQKQVKLSRYDILQIYMVMGGIPHYLQKVKKGESAVQAIDRLCFQKNGFLRNEFNQVFASLFDISDHHETIVRILSKNRKGMSRTDLLAKSKLPSSGSSTRILQELAESGFIEQYKPYRKSNNTLFRLNDEYCSFYLKFIESSRPTDTSVWRKLYQKSSYKSWAGFTFETICIKHVDQIKRGLEIAGVYSQHGSWIKKGDNGAQIDLLIDRDDNVINLCEIKFYNAPFTISKKYADELIRKSKVFEEGTKTKKSIFITMITTYGVEDNQYSRQLIQNSLTLDDLFL